MFRNDVNFQAACQDRLNDLTRAKCIALSKVCHFKVQSVDLSEDHQNGTVTLLWGEKKTRPIFIGFFWQISGMALLPTV